jgi:hypothetical protein
VKARLTTIGAVTLALLAWVLIGGCSPGSKTAEVRTVPGPCGPIPAGSAQQPPQRTAPEPTISIHPAPHDARLLVARGAHGAVAGTTEVGPGVHAKDTRAYLQWAYEFVTRYYDGLYGAMPHPAGLVYVPAGCDPNPSPCLNEADSRPGFHLEIFYCDLDDKFYFEQPLSEGIRQFGDAAIPITFAHEYIHHVQYVAGLPRTLVFGKRRPLAEQRQIEVQADCAAGAWLADAARSRQFGETARHDAQSGYLQLTDNTHGAIANRRAAFAAGYKRGLFACNAFGLVIITANGGR